MEYTFDYIREHGLLLYEYVRGSQAYGLATPTSDEDRGAVFAMPIDNVLGMSDTQCQQIADDRNDVVWYEIARFIELLCKGNPNMLEALFVPERCVVYVHPAFQRIIDNRHLFVTKETFNSMYRYAYSQIEKARGLNKKIVNPIDERKDILDFCYTFKGQGTQPFKDFLAENGLYAKYCGLVHLPNMEQMYGVYYDFGNHNKHEEIDSYRSFWSESNRAYASFCNETFCLDFGGDYEHANVCDFINNTPPIGYRGAMDENNDTSQLRLSSVEKDAEPICYLSYNKNGFSTHCRQYKEYQEWVKKRNPQRYLENKDKEFDRKNMMHCARLLAMGIEIAKTGNVNVDRTGIDRDFLMSIRTGDASYEDLMHFMSDRVTEMADAVFTCTLPETIDRVAVNDLLLSIRRDFFGSAINKKN